MPSENQIFKCRLKEMGFCWVTLAFLLLCFKSFKLFKLYKAQIKPNYYFTPFYFIKTDLKEIRFWYVWEIDKYNPIHHYKNNNYVKTTVDVIIDKFKEILNFKSQAEYLNFIHKLNDLNEIRMNNVQKNNWSWFSENDVFRAGLGKLDSCISGKAALN